MRQEQGVPNKDQYARLADELVLLVQKYPDLPRAVETIIQMLRAGDIKSAVQTFEWEKDKLLYHEEVLELLNRKLSL